jgi:hypothetical protein
LKRSVLAISSDQDWEDTARESDQVTAGAPCFDLCSFTRFRTLGSMDPTELKKLTAGPRTAE